MSSFQNKLSHLIGKIRSYASVAVAFSGGVDSSLLAALTYEYHPRSIAITLDTPATTDEDRRWIEEIMKHIGMKCIRETVPLLDFPEIRSNPPDRCYRCKLILFHRIKKIAGHHGMTHIIEGTNTDDLRDIRPGLKALEKLGIQSPYVAAGFTKADIRRLAHEMALPGWNRASDACLFTRIPFREEITPQRLRRIESAEKLLRDMGCNMVRVRDHGNIARIETNPDIFEKLVRSDARMRLTRHFQALGYQYVTLDLEGYRVGSLNSGNKDEINK